MLKACKKVERASTSMIESRHVQDKCFDQPFTSFIEKSRFTFCISAPELRRDGSQRENVPNPSLDSFLDKITLSTSA